MHNEPSSFHAATVHDPDRSVPLPRTTGSDEPAYAGECNAMVVATAPTATTPTTEAPARLETFGLFLVTRA